MRFSSILLLAAATVAVADAKVCPIANHAPGDDISTLIRAAYLSCVKASPGSTLLVPEGDHELHNPILFEKIVPFTFQIDGAINVPFNPLLGGNIITFLHAENFTVTGKGSIQGNGGEYRKNNDLSLFPNRPRILRLEKCNNAVVENLLFLNAPKFHVVVNGNNNVVRNIQIIADIIGETDGIDISGDSNYVHDVSVEGGDECVTVKSPTTNFLAENIVCKHTAGCNIGSFSNNIGSSASVNGVHYRNVTISNADSGVTVKSYPISGGSVTNLLYEDFTMTSTAHPIDIDLFWCPHTKCGAATGSLTVSNAVFKNFKVSGASGAVQRPIVGVNCLAGHTCTNIRVEGLTTTGATGYHANVITNAEVSIN
ncbi:hypothetical protein HKX48_001406 [Thoreauomyces humboldtii]|nr:hypothetical protein HKX48_001406 [Thoreauomyces humboldtii]